jgi:hypothetical protein
VANSEQAKRFENSVLKPADTETYKIEDRLGSIIDGFGEVTIFQEPTGEDGPSMPVKISPFHFWEASALSDKGRERFIKGVVAHMEGSPCVILRQLTTTPIDNRNA